MSTYQSQLDEVIERAKAQGWQQRDTTGKHYQLFAPDGKGIVTVGRTATDRHAFQNFMSEMKRNGYQPPDDREELLDKRAQGSARKKILDYALKHPDAIITTQDMVALTGTRANNVHVALARLWGSEHLTKLQLGQYKLNASHPDVVKGQPAEPKPEPEPEPETATNGTADPMKVDLFQRTIAPVVELPSSSDEAKRIVDDLLALASRIERWGEDVHRREAAVAKRERKLRALLSELEDDAGDAP